MALLHVMAIYIASAWIGGDSGATLLDAGCGSGLFGAVLAGIRRLKKPRLVGCDIYLPYLRMLPGSIYDDRVLCDFSVLPFRNSVFDGIACIEVIEHLEKDAGKRMLMEFERTCRGTIALSTPFGYKARGMSDGNPFQVHRSGWSPHEFKQLGYRVRFLPRMVNMRWMMMPLALTWYLGLFAHTIIAIKRPRTP